MNIDWSAVNTLLIGTLILTVVRYIYRQTKAVDEMRGIVFGIEGQGGALKEIQLLRERTYDLTQKITTLSATLEELTRVMEQRKLRRFP